MAANNNGASSLSSSGAFLFGGLIASALYAANTSDFARYVLRRGFAKRASLRALVTTIWMVDSINIALYAVNLYMYFITANPRLRVLQSWSVSSLLFTTVLRDVLIRGIFSLPVFRHRQSSYSSTAVVLFLALAAFALGLGISINSYVDGAETQFVSYARLAFAYLGVVIGCDSLITLLQVAYGSNTTSATESNLHDFWNNILTSNMLAAIFGWAPAVTLIALPEALVFFGIHCAVAPLGFTSLLSNLHASVPISIPPGHHPVRHSDEIWTPSTDVINITVTKPESPKLPAVATATVARPPPARSFFSFTTNSSRTTGVTHTTTISFPTTLQHSSSASPPHPPLPPRSPLLRSLTAVRTLSKSLRVSRSRSSSGSSSVDTTSSKSTLADPESGASVYDPELGSNHDHFRSSGMYGPYRLSNN